MKTIQVSKTEETMMTCQQGRNAKRGSKLLVLGTMILTASLAFAQTKISPDLQSAVDLSSAASKSSLLQRMASDLGISTDPSVNVIVQYTAAPSQTNYSTATSAGATLTGQFTSFQGATYSVPLSAVSTLVSSDPTISYVSLDRPLAGAADYGDGAEAISLDIARSQGFDGSGVGVAVIDSGITANNDLKYANSTTSRIVYSQNFVPGATTTSTSDAYGHGTHVAGIIGGNGYNSTCSNCAVTFRGAAPNVRLINLRVLDQNGQGSDSSVIAAIDRAIALKSTYNIRVINLSLGRGVYESYQQDPLCRAVEKAWKAGMVVVVAAGNLGRDKDLVGNFLRQQGNC